MIHSTKKASSILVPQLPERQFSDKKLVHKKNFVHELFRLAQVNLSWSIDRYPETARNQNDPFWEFRIQARHYYNGLRLGRWIFSVRVLRGDRQLYHVTFLHLQPSGIMRIDMDIRLVDTLGKQF
jgi:hypothetical protein